MKNDHKNRREHRGGFFRLPTKAIISIAAVFFCLQRKAVMSMAAVFSVCRQKPSRVSRWLL
jgi:hypothetical protein